jgi:hypothetical protein
MSTAMLSYNKRRSRFDRFYTSQATEGIRRSVTASHGVLGAIWMDWTSFTGYDC